MLILTTGAVYAQNESSSDRPDSAEGVENSVIAPSESPGSSDAEAAVGRPAANRGPDESTLAFANEDAPAAANGSGEVSAFGAGDLIRMVLVLLMVVGAVYGVVALLKRRTAPGGSDDADSPIKLLASRSLGAGREIHAVMIGKQVLIIGGGESSTQLITTVEDQETIDELVLAHSAQAPPSTSFGQAIGAWINNLAVPGSTKASRSPSGAAGRSEQSGGTASSSLLRMQGERLRRLQ